jgi:LuxR family transcriptional regulator, maltose regulon positive regulatory protein
VEGRLVGGQVTAEASLVVPRVSVGEIARPHLVDHLERSDRLTLVIAPAGFGKTTLMAEWAEHQHRGSVVWLSCDQTHREATRFWTALVTAVVNAWPRHGREAAALLERQGESPEVAISLANDLGDIKGTVTLVIDDLHMARPTPWVLLTFLQALPENVRMVIGSRVDLPFSLGRLREAGQIGEIREDALRFSVDESARFLQLAGVELAPEDLMGLCELVEGWPAGLRMALLSMRPSGDDASRLLSSFSGSERGLTDFLVAEVLDALPDDVVEFMLETSVLDTFDVSLCAEMVGEDQASRLLAQLLEAHLFLVPLDNFGERFRYHNLFGEFLRARLKALGGGRRHRAHLRAADALVARGDVMGAMRQVSHLGDTEVAAVTLHAVIAKALEVADRDTTAAVARAWLQEYGRHLLKSDPIRVLDFAATLFLASSSDEIVWWLRRVEDEHPVPGPDLEAKTLDLWAKYYLDQGHTDLAISKANAALAAERRSGHREGLLGTGLVDLALAHLHAGDLAATKRVLAGEVHGKRAEPIIVGRVRLPALAAYVAASEAELGEAEATALRVVRTADQLELPPWEVGRIVSALALAAVGLERNDRDRAGDLLREARKGAEGIARPSLLRLVAVGQAYWCAAMGDTDGALEWIEKARAALRYRSESVETDLDLRAARLTVSLHDDRASVFLGRLPPGPATSLVRARHALVHRDARVAEELLEGIDRTLLSRRHKVQLAVCLALTARDRDREMAARHFGEALALARPEGLIRAILDVGPDLSALFALIPSERGHDDYLQSLLFAAETTVVTPPTLVLPALPEALTDRELVVLRFLSSRLTYKEIASLLYISLNTLKSHVRAVYRKLDVDARLEAVKAGRALHLL